MSSLPKITVPPGADFFLNADGSEFHYVGLSEFGWWKRFNMDNGPDALVRPLLIERRQIADAAGFTGPIVARVFRYADPGNVFGTLPHATDMAKINPFLDLCAEYKCYVDWTCGDSQKDYMLPNPLDQQSHLNAFASSISRFCFLETCNEPFKNGDLPKNGIVPFESPWYLRDSGNYVDINEAAGVYWPRELDLDFISYHGNRTNDAPRWPKWVCDLDDSLATLRRATGKSSVLKETAMFGRDYTDPAAAHELGLRASMGGVLFHSQLGLNSDGYDAAHRVGAGAFFRGAAAALR